MEIFNNTTKVVRDDLEKIIQPGSRISIAAACFSIYAYQELKAQLEACEELRFIFTSPTFIAEKTQKERREFYIPRLKREKSLYGTEFEVMLRNELKQKAVAKECAEWMRHKVCFKSNTTRDGMNNFLLVDGAGETYTYMPMNTFTTVDLGCERGNNLTNMVTRLENPASSEFLRMFNSIWADEEKLTDVTEEVIEMISTVYQENAPELVYFMTLYNIFNEFLEDISEDVLPNEATGFKDSVVWNKLYNNKSMAKKMSFVVCIKACKFVADELSGNSNKVFKTIITPKLKNYLSIIDPHVTYHACNIHDFLRGATLKNISCQFFTCENGYLIGVNN